MIPIRAELNTRDGANTAAILAAADGRFELMITMHGVELAKTGDIILDPEGMEDVLELMAYAMLRMGRPPQAVIDRVMQAWRAE